MSNYTKTTDFEAKDSLPSGDSGKIIRGSEFETEFDNIATAIATKADAASPTFTGTVTIDGLTVNGNTVLGNAATDTVTVTADIASNLIPSADDTYNLGASGAEWNDLYVDGTAHIDAINFNGTAITATGAEINYLDITTLGTVEASKAVTADGSGAVSFPDDKQLRMGSSDDLKIYHNSSNGNSIIAETGSGALSLHTNGSEINFYDSGNARQLASFTTAGATTFRHNGDIKLATTATGANITGTLVADGLTVEKSTSRHLSLSTDTRGDGNGSVVCVDGSSSNLRNIDIEGQQIQLATNAFDQTASIPRVRVATNGDVLFYEDTGTTAKLFWDASAERLGIGTTSPANQLDVISSSTATARIEGGSNSDATLRLTESGISGIQLKYDGTNNLFVIGGGTSGSFTTHMAMTRDAGSVGIGTDSPGANLQVHDTDSAKLWITADGSNPSNAGTLRFAEIQTGGNYFEFLHNGSDNTLTLTSTNGDIITFERSSLSVGIGTTDPSSLFHVQRNGTAVSSGLDSQTAATFQSTGATGSSTHVNILAGSTGSSGQAVLTFGDADDPDIGRITYRNGDNSLAFMANASEGMRLNSSGQFLVGKTSGGTNNVGTQLTGDGYASIVNTSNNIPLYLENKATNGNCRISFTNDSHGGASFGLNNGGDFTIFDTTASTTRFNVTSARVLNASGGLAGIALGGSGSANILDDYEEGSFTPAFSGGDYTFTYNKQKGSYTKIGNRVFVDMHLNIDSSTAPSGSTDGDLSVTGLPFAFNAQNSVDILAVSIGFKQQIANAEDSLSIRFASGNTEFKIHKDLSTGFPDTSLLQASDLVANSRLRIQFSYPTNS